MTAPKEVPADAEGTGALDAAAPVAGAELRAEIDMMAIYQGLPDKEKARFADQLLAAQPAQVAAAQRKRTQLIRASLTALLFGAIVAEAGVALYVVNVAETETWDTVKDWLALSLAPLTAAAAVTAAFWFPTSGSD